MTAALSSLAVRRPVATILIATGIALAGLLALTKLPVSPLPQLDFPVISITANMAGASPATMAATVAAPLERRLGAIADVNEMTSSSSLGSTRVTLQFDQSRNIDGAARDVQAALNAARADLPAALRANPTYHKINPSDAPIAVLALTSKTRPPGELYRLAATVLQQRLSQLDGIGQVDVQGSALPAVRVELNLQALNHYGVGTEDVRAALAAANANTPKGSVEDADFRRQIYANDQAVKAADFVDLVIAFRNGAPIRLHDVADVVDSVEDLRNAGLYGGSPSVGLVISRQPGANIIETVDAIKAVLPRLAAAMPGDVDLNFVVDRSTTIRSSLLETERTLVYSAILVALVVFAFLRDFRAGVIPALALVVSILGSFAAMYLLGFSLNNLSLMALTVSTGFVVDDAIVVLENVVRHLEQGKPPLKAAIDGSAEVSFTVVSISASLVAVFLPLLIFGGLIGRLFREFSVTLSVAVLISLLVSLTLTPCLCGLVLSARATGGAGSAARAAKPPSIPLAFYRSTLRSALRRKWSVIALFLLVVFTNISLFRSASYSFFPTQDTGLLIGSIQADQSISFQAMKEKLTDLQRVVEADPAVLHVVGVTGGRQVNSGFVYVSLKPRSDRDASATAVVDRLRRRLASVAGARLFLAAVSDLRVGGRQSNATYQYSLLSDDAGALALWTPRLTTALETNDVVKDVSSDQQSAGLEADVVVDRAAARRMGINPSAVDAALYDSFGQRQVSTIYEAQNQYHVVMEAEPRNLQDPSSLADVQISTSAVSPSGSQLTNAGAGLFASSSSRGPASASVASDAARNFATNALASSGRSQASAGSAISTTAEPMVPLEAISRFSRSNAATSVSHQGLFAAATISFNLAEGKTLAEAQTEIERGSREIGLPAEIRGSFAGTAAAFAGSQSSLPLLVGASLVTIYIVLGVLYESFVHPITILSTLPSAGVGALVALRVTGLDFTVISFIGVILLVGIVKKNAILMVDFALEAKRGGLSTRAAIVEASVLRFRPILMTTFAGLFGALPLMLGRGEGAELRAPLGIAIVGGLLASQLLTLYTTPVIFEGFDSLRLWRRRSTSSIAGASMQS